MAKERLSDEEKKKRRREYYRKYYIENKKHIRENQKEYYADNREGIREYQNASYKRYYTENKEDLARKNKIYRGEHREELKAKSVKYVDDNREEINARARSTRAEYPERTKEYERLYRQTPKGKVRDKERASLRRARKKNSKIGNLPNNYERTLYETQDGLCYYCKRDLDNLITHLEHKQPLSREGGHVFDNLALACSVCNLKKGAMTEDEFIAYHDRHPEEFDYWVVDDG